MYNDITFTHSRLHSIIEMSALFSVRIFDADYYMERPIKGVDIHYSEYRQTNIFHVPVIRIFGASPVGYKTCLHIHRVFPYCYVQVPENVIDSSKFGKELSSSLDFGIGIALGKSVSQQQQYVHKVELVKRM